MTVVTRDPKETELNETVLSTANGAQFMELRVHCKSWNHVSNGWTIPWTCKIVDVHICRECSMTAWWEHKKTLGKRAKYHIKYLVDLA